MKKYVTINNKENTANILLLNKKVVQKVTDIVGNISLLGFFDSLTEDNLTEFS